MTNNMIHILTDENFSKEIAQGVTLVDFYAHWCGPCRMLTPVLEDLAKSFEGKVKIAKLDIDAEMKVTEQFQVTSVPTLILFNEGKEVNRLIGLRDMNAIREFIAQIVK